MQPALAVRAVSLHFGAVQALDDVTIDVADGELCAVIGPNGAGKTSLLNVLSRTYEPQSGELRLFGEDLRRLRPHQLAAAGMARTFQNPALVAPLTAVDNVLVGRNHAMRSGLVSSGLRLPAARREERLHRARAMEALEFVGAVAVAEAPVGTLPYGLQKRVELARALAADPRLLLLDEPVAGMSHAERDEIAALIALARRGLDGTSTVTTVLVEHDMGVVMGLADRVVVLDFGRVIARGTPAAVQADAGVVRAYLGEPLLRA